MDADLCEDVSCAVPPVGLLGWILDIGYWILDVGYVACSGQKK